MIRTFYHDQPLTTDTLLDSIVKMTPLASQEGINKEIEDVREWAKANAIPANAPMGTATI